MPTDTMTYKKMDPELKAKWIAALRSGKYRQAKSSLRRRISKSVVGYCCLGVACNIVSNRKWHRSDESVEMFDWGDVRYYTDHLDFLDGKAIETLITMNDGEDASFDDIADWVEANL